MASPSLQWNPSLATFRALISLESCRQAVRCEPPAVQTIYCNANCLKQSEPGELHHSRATSFGLNHLCKTVTRISIKSRVGFITTLMKLPLFIYARVSSWARTS